MPRTLSSTTLTSVSEREEQAKEIERNSKEIRSFSLNSNSFLNRLNSEILIKIFDDSVIRIDHYFAN